MPERCMRELSRTTCCAQSHTPANFQEKRCHKDEATKDQKLTPGDIPEWNLCEQIPPKERIAQWLLF